MPMSFFFFKSNVLFHSNVEVVQMYPHLLGPRYILFDQVMLSLSGPTIRRPRSDKGATRCRKSTSTSTTHHHGSSSHPNNNDVDMNDEAKDEEDMPMMLHRQTTMMNRQVSMHMEKQGALKSFG
nr:hypothetical protein [Tanacetum cinerariifolium]